MKKLFKIIGYSLLSVISLLLIIVLLLQTPWAKNLIREKIETYIEKKTNTTFEIAKLDFSLPKWIELDGLFMLDSTKDTLLYGKHIKIDLDMLALIRSKYIIKKVVMDEFYINLYNTDTDSTYNYQFLMDAFKSKTSAAKQADTTKVLYFKIKDIDIAHSHFIQNDHYFGHFMNVSLQKFHLNVDSLDLKAFHVDIDDLTAEGVDFKYIVTKIQKESDGKKTNPIFTINKTLIKNSHIYYENKPDYLLTDNFINYLEVVDLNNTSQVNTYSTKSIVLNNSKLLFQHKAENEVVEVVADTLTAIATNTTSLGIIIKDIALQNNSIIYNNISQPKKPAGFDYYHLDITALKLLASNTKFDSGNVTTQVKSFSFKDKSGFAIDTLSGIFNIDSSNVNIKDFYVETPYSRVEATAVIYLETFKSDNKPEGPLPENEVEITQTIISHKDLELLADTIARMYKKQLDVLGDLAIDAHIKGNVNSLYISSLVLHSLRNNDLNVDVTGTVSNPTDTKKIAYDLNLNEVSASKPLITLFMPKSPEPLNLPNRLSLRGLVKGNMQNVNTDVALNSDFGNADIKADLKGFQNPNKMFFDVALKSNNLETANWIGDEKKIGLVRGEIDMLGNLSINAHVKGTMQKIHIPYFVANFLRNNDLTVALSGDISNPTDTKKIAYNLNVTEIAATKQFISLYIPPTSQPLYLPNRLSLKGLIKGDMQNVNTDISVNSAFGRADIIADLKGFQNPNEMIYEVALHAADLETGKWVGRDSTFGLLNGNIKVKGNSGFDVKTNNMYVLSDIQSFRYNQNVINNINTDLDLKQGLMSGTASINDALIKIMFDGTANIQTDYPTVTAVVNIPKADLFTLGLTKDSIIVTAYTRLQVENTTPQHLNALIQIDSSVITKGTQVIKLDSTRALAFVRNDTTFIEVKSPFADAALNSTVYYNQILPLVQQIIKQFVPPAMVADVSKENKNSQDSTSIQSQQLIANNQQPVEGAINAAILIKPNPLYSDFVKDLILKEPISINANLNTANIDTVVNVTFNVPSLTMSSLHVSQTNGRIVGRNDSLLVNIISDTLQASSVLLYDAHIKGGFTQNHVHANILTHDINKKEQYNLTVFAVPNHEEGYDISLGKDLLLNKTKWFINENNQVKTTPEGFNVQNFVIRSEQQEIKINNETDSANSPILVNVTNFQLKTISALLDQNTLSVEGLMNADAKISDLKNTIPTIEGQIKIDSIIYQNLHIGNLEVQAQSEKGEVNVAGRLFGKGNEVNVKGTYAANKIDANIQLNPLTMTTLESLSQKQIKNSSGTITGNINLTGEPKNPIWNGEIVFNKAQTTAVQYGTFIKIDNQTLRLNYPTLYFDKFTLQDDVDNKLTIDGTISQTRTNDFTTDLVLHTRDFHALNSKVADNNMIYGIAIIDLDAQLRGDISTPDILGHLVVKKGTDITYVRQVSSPSAKEREGVIEFIDMDTIPNLLAIIQLQDSLITLQEGEKSGNLNFNLNMEIEKEAKFLVIVDPASGDELEAQGTANINVGLNPNGSIGLVGNYDLSKGFYELHYQFIKRKFTLLEGSTITFSGDPMEAEVDITAAYDVKTPALDLVKNEIGGSTAAGNDIYKRKSPFQVLLKVKGKVNKPEIAFDIILPERAEGVTTEMAITINNKLDQLRADQSSMNKQVFAILILNRFIGEQSNDFFAGNGVNNRLLSNESVSSFLNGAINQIANDLIKGVDVDVNLKNVDDDPNAQRTDLNVALGKTFLNDRLNITVGKSFTVDGTNPTTNNTSANTQFIPDVNTTYKLTKDGRFMLRAYRKNQYESLLDGYFIETGASINFTVDYDKLQELTKKNKKE